MGGQPKTLQTQQQDTSQKAPLQAQAPYYADLWARTQPILQNDPGAFKGNFIAQPGQDAQQGLQTLRDATPLMGQGAGDFLNMAQATARGDYLNPASNPFLQGVADAMTGTVRRQLTEGVLPNIKDAAISQGAYGGARQDVQENQAVRQFDQQALDATNQLFANNYAAERNRQMQAGGLLQQGYGLAAAPGQFQLGIDEASRGLQQLALDNARQQWMEQRSAPWYGLGQAANILQTGGFGSTTGTTNQIKPNPSYEDPMLQALKIALGGGSAVAAAGGKGGFGLWGV